MPRREKGILGAPRDGKNPMLFSFSVREGEEWQSDSSDSDWAPSDHDSPVDNGSKKAQNKRKSSGNQETDSESERCKRSKSMKRLSSKDRRKKPSRLDDKSSLSNNGQKTTFESGGERYTDVWAKKMPPEILLKIFQCVCRMDGGALPFLARASKTCRLWREVSQSPVLWHVVDMSFGWVKSTDSTLVYLCPNRFKCLREIKLNGWKHLTNTGVQAIADNCPELHTINLSGCSKVNSIGVKVLVDRCDCLHSLDLSATSTDAVSSQSLKYLVEKVGPRLQALAVGCNTLKGFNNSLNSIIEHCSNLLCFDASNANFMSDFFSLNIERFQMGCPKLRILRLANTRLRGSNVTNAAKDQSLGFTDMQELSLAVGARVSPVTSAGGIGIDDEFLQRMLKTSSHLKLLDLRSCCSVTNHGIQHLPATHLQQLFISQCSIARFEGIQVIMQKWQHSLVELDLSWNIYPGASFDIAMNKIASNPQHSKLQILNLSGTSIAFPRLKSILEGCPHLKKLNLQSCRGLPRGMKKDFEGETLNRLREEIVTFGDEHDDRR
ncbi:F-box/LRR-repeat protein 6-like isoform X2 [Lineus longissimus]